MEKILISACLLGLNCRYDGRSSLKEDYRPLIEELSQAYQLIPFCPEIYGGLATPRPPAEILGSQVINRLGQDVTGEYHKGAREALRLARFYGARLAVLKERSPSCGSGQVYDGSFSSQLVPGDGITAQLLKENSLEVYGESEIQKLIEKKP